MSPIAVVCRESSWGRRVLRRLAPVIFDGVSLGLIWLWFNGGVFFQGHLYLKHGADPRRVLILWGISGYLVFKRTLKNSYFLRMSLKVGEFLSVRHFRWGFYFLGVMGAIRLAVDQSRALRVTLYDVGIFHQILWSLANGLGFNSTISGAGNFLKDHFSPALVLLVPFFKLSGESPYFFPVIQVLLIFGGGAAWVYLAERASLAETTNLGKRVEVSERVGDKKRSKTQEQLAAATTVFIFGFESLWRNVRWGFHENVIAFFCVSWALALLFSSGSRGHSRLRSAAVFILFLIAAGSQEILMLDIAVAFVVWAIFDFVNLQKTWALKNNIILKKGFNKSVWFPLLKLAMAVGLVLGFVIFERMGHPPDKNYFNRYYAYLGTNLNDFISSLLIAPGLIYRVIGPLSMMRYILVVFMPWFFLFPVLKFSLRRRLFSVGIGSALWGLMILPSFASAALADFPLLRDPGFHYVLELWPVLACLTLLGLARQKSTRLIWSWALVNLLIMDFDPVGECREYHAQASTQTEVREMMKKIPISAAVMADDLAGTWVAGRRSIMRWPETSLLPFGCPNFILIQNTDFKQNVRQQSFPRGKEILDIARRCGDSSGNSGIGSGENKGGIEGVIQTSSWALYKIGKRNL